MVKKFVFIAFSVILFASCNTNELEFDNIDLPTVNGTFDFPLGTATYTIRELILDQEDSTLDFQVDEDSLITLLYYDSISYESNTDFIQIDDISNGSSIDLSGIAGTAGPATIPLNQSFTFNFDPTDPTDVIDSAFYSGGEVTISVTTDVQGTLDYTFTLNNFVTATNEIPLEVSSTNPTRRLDIPQHKVVLSGTNNTFSVDFAGNINLGAGQNFTGTESIAFDITFANQTFSVIYGKFGQDTVQVGSETVNIEFFKEMGEEGIFFGNPVISFFFENSFGIPIGIDFSGLYGDDGEGGQQTFLSGDIVDNVPVIASGDINNPGALVRDTIRLNNGNSSLVDLLATSPARLGFDVSAISNPEDPNQINFITNQNEINATVEIEIPLEVRLEDLEQSINLSLNDGFSTDFVGDEASEVDSASLRILTVNEMPFSATLQIEVKDSTLLRTNGTRPPGDSTLFSTPGIDVEAQVLASPFINVDGEVTDPNGIFEDIPLSNEGIEIFSSPPSDQTYIKMRVTLNTPGSLNSRDIFVKILSNYRLEVSLGIRAVLRVDLDDL